MTAISEALDAVVKGFFAAIGAIIAKFVAVYSLVVYNALRQSVELRLGALT